MNTLDLRYVADLRAAGWIGDRLHPFAQGAGSVVPDGFEDYARILHAAHHVAPERAVSWREIATANGRTIHAEMQFGNIAGTWSGRSPQPDLWSVGPRVGSLPLELASALVTLLRPRTATPDRCWFAVWEGWGDLGRPRGVPMEVDLSWTYVGGTKESIDAVLAHPDVEALRARVSDGIAYDSDTVNPPPEARPSEGSWWRRPWPR